MPQALLRRKKAAKSHLKANGTNDGGKNIQKPDSGQLKEVGQSVCFEENRS